MTRISIKLAVISLVLVCTLSIAAPALAQSTIIKVDVYPNGDARWTTEKMIPLDTPDDVAGWDATAAQGTKSYLADFTIKMKDYVARISDMTGRNMTVKDVNVTVQKSQPYALSDNGSHTYGVISYQFTWTGFAMASGNALEVGDAFVDGYLMNAGDSITFTLPAGYNITSISPDADDFKKSYQPQVRWVMDSTNDSDFRLFPGGEPSIIMEKTAVATAFSLEWWMLVPVILVSAIAGFGVAYLLLRRPQPEAPPVPDMDLPDAEVEAPEELPGPGEEGRFMSDEERIVKFLEEAGGQMFQSDLVKKTDFSKSKLSMVLTDLKEKGTIIKIKKGKENLIRLNRPDKQEEPPKE